MVSALIPALRVGDAQEGAVGLGHDALPRGKVEEPAVEVVVVGVQADLREAA